jgi:aminopeptidase N
LTSNLGDDDHLFLMANDGDPFNRWESCQTYAGKRLLECVDDAQQNRPLRTDAQLADALGSCLTDDALEPAFVSLMITLPAESDLAARIGSNVDPWAIHTAREHLKRYLAQQLTSELAETYARLTTDKAYAPDAKDAGERSLRNSVLALLTCADGPELAFEQFRGAGNMTDTMGALTVLAATDAPEREQALAAFYERNASDHLLVDKWFALSAIAPFPDKMSEIRTLTDHPAFSLKTPNKVRALVGTFSMANPVCFNHEDGSGYRFLADVVLALDPINPQVAARLSAAFKSWRALEPGRRDLARTEIERIQARNDLSRDTFEIVSKTLQ